MADAAKTEAAKGPAPANPKAANEDNVERLLTAWLPTIAELAGEMIDPRKVVKTAILARRKQPALRECSPESLVMALCQLTESGLEPDGIEAALVPFNGEVQAIPMFQGLAKLLYSSGLVKDVYADVFYEGELKTSRFRYRKGTAPEIHHEPIIGTEEERGKALGAYAVVHLATGGILVDVMNADEIEERRAISRSADNAKGPWKNWPLEMWKKTVLRRLAKTAPKSEQLRKALAVDSTDYDVQAEVVAREPVRGTAGLKSVVRQLAEPAPKVYPPAAKEKEPVPARRQSRAAPAQAATPSPAGQQAPTQAQGQAPAATNPPAEEPAGNDDEPSYNEPPETSDAEQREFEEGFRR